MPTVEKSQLAWVMVRPDGNLLIDTREFLTEADVWCIVLGWPDREEIEEAMQEGYRVVRARVSIEEV